MSVNYYSVEIPTWVAIYIALYISFSIWAHVEDWRARRCIDAWVIVEAAGNLALIGCALAYWSSAIYKLFHPYEGWLAAIGLIALLVFLIRKVLMTVMDLELSPARKWLLSVVGVGFLALINAPLLWGAGKLLRGFVAQIAPLAAID